MTRYMWGESERFRVREVSHVLPTGLRPGVQRIVDLVDMTDPAWPRIAAVLSEFHAASIELDAGSVEMAVKLGRGRWGKREPDVQPTLFSAASSIVYYVRRGALIKIGTTVQPRKRFSSLMPDAILAIEPGGRGVERARHCQFMHLRAGTGREYFRDTAELLDHARQVRSAYGEPDPSWPTTRANREDWRMPLATSTDTMTAAEAEAELGILQVTIRVWKTRGRIELAGKGPNGASLFYREHLIRLRDSTRRRLVSG